MKITKKLQDKEPLVGIMEITENVQENADVFIIDKSGNKYIKLDEKEDIEQIKRECVDGTDFHMFGDNTLLNVILSRMIKYGKMPSVEEINYRHKVANPDPDKFKITDMLFIKLYMLNRDNVKNIASYLNNKDEYGSTELHKICKLNIRFEILEILNPIKYSKLYFKKDITGNSLFTYIRDNRPTMHYTVPETYKDIFAKLIEYNIDELSAIYNINKYYDPILFGIMSIMIIQYINIFGIYNTIYSIPLIISYIGNTLYPDNILPKILHIISICIITVVDYVSYKLNEYMDSRYVVQTIFNIGLIIIYLILYTIIPFVIVNMYKYINKKTIIHKIATYLY